MRVLMVCTGNICRSTMAHQVLDEALAAGGLSGAVRVDSAGVSDEEHGNPIDPVPPECCAPTGTVSPTTAPGRCAPTSWPTGTWSWR